MRLAVSMACRPELLVVRFQRGIRYPALRCRSICRWGQVGVFVLRLLLFGEERSGRKGGQEECHHQAEGAHLNLTHSVTRSSSGLSNQEDHDHCYDCDDVTVFEVLGTRKACSALVLFDLFL